jgi:hypothetical protein
MAGVDPGINLAIHQTKGVDPRVKRGDDDVIVAEHVGSGDYGRLKGLAKFQNSSTVSMSRFCRPSPRDYAHKSAHLAGYVFRKNPVRWVAPDMMNCPSWPPRMKRMPISI